MVAEDSSGTRMLIRDWMEIRNHEIIAEVETGIDAVTEFNNKKPDVLLLDIAMPKKDGLTVLKEIKAANPNAKIIMMTANEDQNVITQCAAHGSLAYLIKPFDEEQLMAAIAMALDEI
jgi:two-component system chemotaxis response regulator CheY